LQQFRSKSGASENCYGRPAAFLPLESQRVARRDPLLQAHAAVGMQKRAIFDRVGREFVERKRVDRR
jgi:hypothetical protein